MKPDRYSQHDAFSPTEITFLNSQHSVAELLEAIESIEIAVKNGMFYQAAELSDWVSFVAKESLEDPKNSALLKRLEIERLKRFDYLGFVDEAQTISDTFCKKYNLNKTLKMQQYENDEDRSHLFTAIGHLLWHEKDLETFESNHRKCELLYQGLSDSYEHKYIFEAFYVALRARYLFLSGAEAADIIDQFEKSLSILEPQEKSNRSNLHILIQFSEHLLLLMEKGKDNVSALSTRLEEILKMFEKHRTASVTSGGKLQPMRTLLLVHFLVLKVKKRHFDMIQELVEDLKAAQKEFEHAKTELLFTTIMLGLGHLNPCPPIVKDVYKVIGDQIALFDIKTAKAYLKKLLLDVHWETMEEVVACYYRIIGYEVCVLQRNAPAFDLLVRPNIGKGLYTGIQVKHWKTKKFSSHDFNEWKIRKVPQFDRNDQIEKVVFFVTKSPDISVRHRKKDLELILKKIAHDVEFKPFDEAIDELFAKYPGSLPLIYQAINAD